MNDWLEFEGRIEPLEWGRATYTILRLPSSVADALAVHKTRRVEGEINDQPFNLALSRAPVVEGVFLWTGQSLLDRLSVEPGELLEIRLRPAPADEVDTPDDVMAALRAAGATVAWEALSPGKRRGLIYKVETAKTAPTRLKRIAALVTEVQG